jgi:sugar diacid utilization regulator
MKGLMLRLSQLDANAETALRIISVFDQLIEHRATLNAVVRTTAGLAECWATLTDETSGTLIRFDAAGRPSRTVPSYATVSSDVTIDGTRVGQVSLERQQEIGPFDELLIERMSMAASACWPHYQQDHYSFISDPALLEVVIGADQDAAQRSRARRLLGFSGMDPMCVIAISRSPETGLDEDTLSPMRQIVGATVAKAAVLDFRGAVVVQLRREDRSGRVVFEGSIPSNGLTEVPALRIPRPTGLRIGAGTIVAPENAHLSWLAAATALRFTSPDTQSGGDSAVCYDDLGSLATLESVPVELAARNPDVASIAKLAATERGSATISTVDAFCKLGSLRLAAEELHLHHSSVASRLRFAEKSLSVSLEDPQHRVRIVVALTLWRLGQSGTQ